MAYNMNIKADVTKNYRGISMGNGLLNLIVTCSLIFIVGIFADPKFADVRIGDVMMFGAVLYFIIALGLLVTKRKSVMEYVKQELNSQQNKKIEDELLRSKQLLENAIISQEEFDVRVKKLKESLTPPL